MSTTPTNGRCPRCEQHRPLFRTNPEWGGTLKLMCSPCWQKTAESCAEKGWDVRCETCDEAASDDPDWGGDGPPTKYDAQLWKDIHQCEPYVVFISPLAAVARAS